MSSEPLNLVPKYEAGEKILCFHGPLLYESKCLKVKKKDEVFMYFVHYQGWNKNWDEWVSDRRMFKFNEEGLRKQKEIEQQVKSGKKVKILRKSDLKKQAYPPPEIIENIEQTLRPIEEKQQEKKSKEAVSDPKIKQSDDSIPEETEPPIPQTPALPIEPNINLDSVKQTAASAEETMTNNIHTSASGRRRKGRPTLSDISIENGHGFLTAPQLNINIPHSLKAWLVDDWDLITRQARLYELPAVCPISSLLVDFLQPATNSGEIKVEPVQESNDANSPPISSDVRHEFVAGLQHYFNQIVGSQLLYKFERLQYAELLKQHTDKRMSDVYGPMHLLRLFVKLREMITCTRVDPNSIHILESLINEFLVFLNRNRKKYLRLEDFTVATAEYQRRAMC